MSSSYKHHSHTRCVYAQGKENEAPLLANNRTSSVSGRSGGMLMVGDAGPA